MKTLSRKLLLALIIALPLAGVRAGTYTCDFTQGLDSNRWSLATSYPYDCYSNTIDARGITFQRVADPPPEINPRGDYWSGLVMSARTVTTNGGFIIGDFTMTYTYTNLTNFTAQGSWESWAVNYVKARMGWGMGLEEQHLAIGRRAASAEGWIGWVYQDVWWGRAADSPYYGYHMTNAASVGNSATFKVVRTNGVQSYYANDLWFGTDGMDLNGGWFTTNDMSDFTLVLEQQGAAEHVGVTFQSFSVSGPSIADAAWPPRSVLKVIFTTNTTIDAGIPTYDAQDIVVSNCALTVNGAHSFASLLLTSNALLTHASAANGETDNRLDLTIAGDATVDPASAINTTGLGYGANLGPGRGGQTSWGGPGGGGHGGNGGGAIPDATAGGPIYGSITAPITCGSGGNYHGGAGGGVVRLTVGGTLTVDGAISVSGNDAYWTDGGGGAGGSIFLSAATLAGTGSIRADGGAGGSPSGDGGGGGGRLALLADTLSFSGSLSAVGGSGFQAGGAGTIFTRVAAEPYGRLVLHNAGRAGYTRFGVTNWAAGQVFALSLAGAARLVPLTPITVSQLEITDAAMLTHDRMGQPLRVNVLGSAVIGTGASIDVAGAGYNDTNPGPGRGGYTSWGAGGGGGYGGRGGQGLPGEGSGGKTYGIFSEPLEFGSAAGGRGTYGGGSVRLAVGGRLTVDGTITADAQGGNAAGGSVYLVCAELAGGGDILARGSAAASSDSGGGGGGRIAVHAGTMSFLGTTSVAGGPGGFEGGGAGTIYLTNSAVLCGSVRSATQQGLAGASISATGGYTTFTDAQGGFLLLLPSDWSGSVSATATNQILTPATRALTHVTTPRFGIDFAAETLRRPALSFQNSAGLLRLSWDSQSGPNYQVYSTPDFINWSAYGPLHPGTGNPVTLDCPMTNSPGLFFRVQAIGN